MPAFLWDAFTVQEQKHCEYVHSSLDVNLLFYLPPEHSAVGNTSPSKN